MRNMKNIERGHGFRDRSQRTENQKRGKGREKRDEGRKG